MPRNGSGAASRVHDWTADADAAINIRADRMDEDSDDFAQMLTDSLAKDGQTMPTANLPMGGFRHTGVGNATGRTQYVDVAGLQDGLYNWKDGGGTPDAITATYSPAVTALVDGQLCFVRATGANTITNPTFSPNALTAHTIVKQGGLALLVGDIRADGHELVLRYDLTNTRWELLNPKFFSGTVTNDDAPAGAPGESPSANVAQPSSVALTTATSKTIASLPLTAGDWDVSFVGAIEFATATATKATASISLTNDTVDATLGRFVQTNPALTTTSNTITQGVPPRRISLAAPATVYGVVQATFSAGTAFGYGNISARRVR